MYMLEFREINIKDRDWINPLLQTSDFMGCEYSFANNLAWRRLADSKICRYMNFYIICSSCDSSPCFVFPAGEGNYKAVINEMKKYSEMHNAPLVMTGVTQKILDILNESFPGQFEIKKAEGSNDYIYLADNLKNLNGKKYHKKRNHLNQFYKYNWTFSEIRPEDFDDCISLSVDSYNQKQGIDSKSSVAEQFAIHTFFSNFSELELKGGVLKIDDKLAAFTLASRLNSETIDIHVEKADINFEGAFTAINNEFMKFTANSFKYVNREEDLGIEGLRKSKLSYYPEFLLEKSVAVFK